MSFDNDTPAQARAKTKVLMGLFAVIYSPVFISLVIAWMQGKADGVSRPLFILLLLPELAAIVYMLLPIKKS